MFLKVFEYQVNRLFWPEGFTATNTEISLPDYVRKMMQTRLKAIYYYRSRHGDFGLQMRSAPHAILTKSMQGLSAASPSQPPLAAGMTAPEGADIPSGLQGYRRVGFDRFLAGLGVRFQ